MRRVGDEGEVWLAWRAGDYLDQGTFAQYYKQSTVIHVLLCYHGLVAGVQVLLHADGALLLVPLSSLYPAQPGEHLVTGSLV